MRAYDDHFFCFENILNKPPLHIQVMLKWGSIHIKDKAKRPEKSITMFSKDLVRIFLHQDFRAIRCHPLSDQMITLCADKLKKGDVFLCDSWLHHRPIVREELQLKKLKEVPKYYICICGIYTDGMKTLWINR